MVRQNASIVRYMGYYAFWERIINPIGLVISNNYLRASISKTGTEISTLDTFDKDKTKNPIGSSTRHMY